jgi:outer membrane protein assembly factor BamD (BamD/ComL family)
MPAPLESADIPKTIASPGNLELGELYFRSGNYSKAIGEYEAFFRNSPTAKGGDLALFHLGLSQALSTDSDRNFHRAEAAFKRLISEFPDSIYKNQAEFILGLQAQIDRLSSDLSERDDRIRKLSKELQVLKDIDLQRRPSRPNE